MSSLHLSVAGLTIRKSKRKILEDVSIEIKGGTITGLVGPNGAGKSSLLRILSGLSDKKKLNTEVQTASGAILSLSAFERKKAVAYLGSDLSTEFPLTARECIELSFSETWQNKMSEDALGIESFLDQPLETLSSGERQRVGFARLLLQDPKCFCLDESFSQLDPEHLSSVQNVIRTKRDEGHSFLLVSHDWSFLSALCDTWVFLKDGKIILTGSSEGVLTETHLQKLYSKAEPYFWLDPKTGRRRIQFL